MERYCQRRVIIPNFVALTTCSNLKARREGEASLPIYGREGKNLMDSEFRRDSDWMNQSGAPFQGETCDRRLIRRRKSSQEILIDDGPGSMRVFGLLVSSDINIYILPLSPRQVRTGASSSGFFPERKSARRCATTHRPQLGPADTLAQVALLPLARGQYSGPGRKI